MEKWRGTLEREIEFIGQRQHVENTKSAAHQCLSASRIPGEAETRLEVSQRRIPKERRTRTRCSGGQILQVGNAVMRFGGHGHHLIAQSGVEDKVHPQPDIILDVGACESFTQSDIGHGRRLDSLEDFGLIGQETSERIEAKVTIYVTEGK